MKIDTETFPKNNLIYTILLFIGFLSFDYMLFCFSDHNFDKLITFLLENNIIYIGAVFHLSLVVCLFIFIYQVLTNKIEKFSVNLTEKEIEFLFADKTKNFNIFYADLKLLDIKLRTHNFIRRTPGFCLGGTVQIPFQIEFDFLLYNNERFYIKKSFNMLWKDSYEFLLELNKYLSRLNYSFKIVDQSEKLLPKVEAIPFLNVELLEKRIKSFRFFSKFLAIWISIMVLVPILVVALLNMFT